MLQHAASWPAAHVPRRGETCSEWASQLTTSPPPRSTPPLTECLFPPVHLRLCFSFPLPAALPTMHTVATSAAAFVVTPPAETFARAPLARHAAAGRPPPPPDAALLPSRGRWTSPLGCRHLPTSTGPPSLVKMAGDAPPTPVVTVGADGAAVGDTLGTRVLAAAAAAVSARGVFRLAVSGGSLPKTLAAGLEGAKGDGVRLLEWAAKLGGGGGLWYKWRGREWRVVWEGGGHERRWWRCRCAGRERMQGTETRCCVHWICVCSIAGALTREAMVGGPVCVRFFNCFVFVCLFFSSPVRVYRLCRCPGRPPSSTLQTSGSCP